VISVYINKDLTRSHYSYRLFAFAVISFEAYDSLLYASTREMMHSAGFEASRASVSRPYFSDPYDLEALRTCNEDAYCCVHCEQNLSDMLYLKMQKILVSKY
jgi:hypothetical protein